MRIVMSAVLTAMIVLLASQADAGTCKIDGVTRSCDFDCPSGTACTAPSHAGCDDDPLDGYCTICGRSGTQFIIGTSGADWICGKGGNDFILAGDGADLVDGGGGNDEIYGDGGDDVLVGGGGNDLINGGVGTDSLDGGSGNDELVDFGVVGTLGGTLCGGTGDDTLDADAGFGGWFCLDGGTQQAGSADCTCVDFGSSGACTARNCADAVGDIVAASPCGCAN